MAALIPSLVRAAAELGPERVAMWFPVKRGYKSLTYADLTARVASVARGLADRGVQHGDRVVMLVPMRPELYVALLAVMSLGAVAVFVEPGSRPAELARVVRVVGPKAFIGVPKAHLLRPVFSELGRVPVRIILGRPLPGLPADTFASLQQGAPLSTFPDIAANEPAILTFSSGTTGEPKGAVRSHGFLAAQHRAIEELFASKDRSVDVDLTAFAIGALSCFASGATAILPRMGRGGVDDIDGSELLDLIEEKRVTTLSGAPAFLAALLASARDRGAALSSVHRVTSGGAPVSVELCELTAAILPAARFSVVYGSTEAEPIAVIDGPALAAQGLEGTRRGKGLCVGRVHHDVTLRLLSLVDGPIEVRNVDDMAVAPGEVGEVVVSGQHVNRHYYRNPDAERATKICDAEDTIWHRTGDTAYLDPDDRLWIVGRKGDVVTCADGSVLHPASVDAIAQTVPFVARAALVSDSCGIVSLVVQPRQRRHLAAWFASRHRRTQMLSQLTDSLRACSVAVDRVHLVPTIPVDSRHRSKIDYKRVRRMLPLLRWLP